MNLFTNRNSHRREKQTCGQLPGEKGGRDKLGGWD